MPVKGELPPQQGGEGPRRPRRRRAPTEAEAIAANIAANQEMQDGIGSNPTIHKKAGGDVRFIRGNVIVNELLGKKIPPATSDELDPHSDS